MTSEAATLRELAGARRRSRFLQGSVVVVACLVITAWSTLNLELGDLFTPRRLHNIDRFMGELVPYALRGKGFAPLQAVGWFWDFMADKGWAAAVATFWIAIVSIVLAGVGGLLITLPAARNIAHPEPFLGVEPGLTDGPDDVELSALGVDGQNARTLWTSS